MLIFDISLFLYQRIRGTRFPNNYRLKFYFSKKKKKCSQIEQRKHKLVR